MAFYGRNNATDTTNFKFDRIYSNRVEMEANTSSDGIFLNRYILIEYDKEFVLPSQEEGYKLYGENTYNQIRAILNEDLTIHQKNSKIDSITYQSVREYDSTVWVKTSIHTDDGNEQIKYVQIAELNSVVPTLNIKLVAPSLEAKDITNASLDGLPGFDKTNSTNVSYDLYMQPIWQFTEEVIVNPIDENLIAGNSSSYDTSISAELNTDTDKTDLNGNTHKQFTFSFPIIGSMFSKMYELLYGGTGDKKNNPDKDTPMGIANDFNNIVKNTIPYKANSGYRGFTFDFVGDSVQGVKFEPVGIEEALNDSENDEMIIEVHIDSDGVFLGQGFKYAISEQLKELLNTEDVTKKKITDAIEALIEEYNQFTDTTNETVNNYISEFNELETAYNQLNWANENESFQMATSSNYLIDNNYQADLSKEEPIQPNDSLNTALAKLEGQIANNTIDQVFVINEENAGNLPAVIENKIVFIEIDKDKHTFPSPLCLSSDTGKQLVEYVIEDNTGEAACVLSPQAWTEPSSIRTYIRGSWLYQNQFNEYLIAIPSTSDIQLDILNDASRVQFDIAYRDENNLPQVDSWVFTNIKFNEAGVSLKNHINQQVYKLYTPIRDDSNKFTEQLLAQVKERYSTEEQANYEEQVLNILNDQISPPSYCPIWTEPKLLRPKYITWSENPNTNEGQWERDFEYNVTYKAYMEKEVPAISINNCNIQCNFLKDSSNYIISNSILDFNNCRIQSLSLGSIPLKGYEVIEQENYSLPVTFNNCEIFNFNNLVEYVASDLSLKQTAGYDISFINSTINNSIIQASASKITMEDSVFNNCEFSSATSSYEEELVYSLTGDSTTYYKSYRFNNKKVTYNNCLLDLGSSMRFGEYENEHLTFINSKIQCCVLYEAAWPKETYRTFMGCSGSLNLTNNANTLYNYMKPKVLNDLNNFTTIIED